MRAAVRAGWRIGAAAAALRGRAGRPLSQAAGEGGGAEGGGGGGGGSGSREAVERLVREHPVVVFMKGSPAQPLCGFSNAVVQILRLHGVEDYRAHDVLQDPDLRQGQRRARVTSGCRLPGACAAQAGSRCGQSRGRFPAGKGPREPPGGRGGFNAPHLGHWGGGSCPLVPALTCLFLLYWGGWLGCVAFLSRPTLWGEGSGAHVL